ncbi:uncharacterized protein LOC132546082 [Ylistrum balloti]|uniref:uncharacterized protein LOC132546082 n=1 Tax=Ylistrum balloti TaxID=509963 RepID=UPI002905A1F4|nr:uncharacterized protein LOC132546082 [Ylistrum balloti]
MENDIEDMEGDSDGPKNLFASATESMIKIVKKVLNVEDKPNTEDLGLNETININDTDKGSALPANVTSDGYMLPCVPGHSEEEVSKQSSTIDQPNTSILGGTGTNMQTATASMDVGTDEHPVDKSASIVTKLEDHEQVPSSLEEQPIVTLLDREESEVSLSDLITKCLTKAPRKKGGSKHRLTSTKRASAFCTYVQILLRNTRPETCSVKRIPPAGKAEVGGKDIDTHSSEKKVVGENNFIIVTKDVLLEASTIPTSVSNDTGSSSPHPTPSSQSTPVMSNYSPIDKSADTSTVTNVIEDLSSLTQISEKSLDGDAIPKMSVPDATVTTIDIEPSKVLSHEEISTTINPVSVEESQKSEINGQKTLTPGEITLDPSIVSSSAQVDSSHTTPALDSVTVTGSKLEEGKSSESFTSQRIESQEPKKNDQNPNAEMEVTSTKLEIVSTKVSTTTMEPLNTSDNLEMFDSDAEVMSSIVDKLASAILDDPQNGHSRIINDTVVAANATQKSSGMPQKDLGLVNVKVPVLPHSKREIALMRLANRINALEMNVTLSIRFLERMSQKFKTKSDEMIKALNRTDTKLEETIQEAATRGEKQQEDMKRMEMKLKNLTVMMEEMIHNMDTLNQKVTDRQMVWTSVEVIILVIIFMVCLRRGKSPSYIPMPPEVQKILDKFPNDMDLTALPRRNSFHGTIQHSSVDRIGGSLQKYNSETALSCSQDISGYDPGGATNISSCSNQQKDMPKRKKRKKKSPDIKISGVSDRLKHHSSLPESHTNINSAGLLFGASSEETTVCEKLDRTSSEGTKWTLPSDNKLVSKSEVEPVYCKSDSSDTSVTSKGQESKVRVSYSSSDIPDCVPEGSTKLTKVKAHSFTSELPVSVISSKPPKCPVAPGQVVGKSKRGSPPMMRALADPGGGGGGASKKKRHSYGHHILLDYNTQAPAEVETVRPNINGNHISTSQTATSEQQNNRQPQQHRPKRKSHTRAASDDLSSVPDTSTASWKNMFRWK